MMKYRINVSLPAGLAERLERWAAAQHRSAASVVRQALQEHLDTDPAVSDPLLRIGDWSVYGQRREVGAGVVYVLRSKHTDRTGHRVFTADGWQVDIRPDSQTSGQKRSHAISEALTAAHGRLYGAECVSLLLGYLYRAGVDLDAQVTVAVEPHRVSS